MAGVRPSADERRHLKQPDAQEHPRPPEIVEIWHNAFHDEIGENAKAIEAMLAATATILAGVADEKVQQSLKAKGVDLNNLDLEEHADLATSVKQALQLSRKVRLKELKIALNKPAKGRLMFLRKKLPAAISVGKMKFFVLGPREADLDKLRTQWNKWLHENDPTVKKIQRKAKDDLDRLTSNVNSVIGPMLDQAEELGKYLAAQKFEPQGLDAGPTATSKLGHRSGITAPNLASLMFLVEEGKKTLLLTGDGFADDICDGLKQHGKLDAQGKLHVNCLKIQHHGANANMTVAFAEKITADDYVFCGNGQHDNPELKVIDAIVNGRLVGPPGKFKLWFNCSSSIKDGKALPAHMKKVEARAKALKAKSGGRMDAFFLKAGSFQLSI